MLPYSATPLKFSMEFLNKVRTRAGERSSRPRGSNDFSKPDSNIEFPNPGFELSVGRGKNQNQGSSLEFPNLGFEHGVSEPGFELSGKGGGVPEPGVRT